MKSTNCGEGVEWRPNETATGDPPQPSLRREGVVTPKIGYDFYSNEFAPSLNREGWGGSLLMMFWRPFDDVLKYKLNYFVPWRMMFRTST